MLDILTSLSSSLSIKDFTILLVLLGTGYGIFIICIKN